MFKQKKNVIHSNLSTKFLLPLCSFLLNISTISCLAPCLSYAQSSGEDNLIPFIDLKDRDSNLIDAQSLDEQSRNNQMLEEKGKKKLKEIHSKLQLLHGNLSEEYPEQLMSATFLSEDAIVLELGGNVGRNSCVIASILKNPYHLVVAESSPDIAKQLQENRNYNKMHFHIEAAAISKIPLVQNFWSTIPSTTNIPGYFRVNTITFEDLEKKYNLKFNTLVVDCEGALYYMLKDDPSILKNIRLIIIENDFTSPEHYKVVAELFAKNGLKLIYTKPLENIPTPLPCKDYFFQVWSK